MRIDFRECWQAAKRTWQRAQAALDKQPYSARSSEKTDELRSTPETICIKRTFKPNRQRLLVANVNLGYTQIVAPAAGSIGERHVQEGQLVAPGMQLVDLVKGDVWIQANYKETQLTNIQKRRCRRYQDRYFSRNRAPRESS